MIEDDSQGWNEIETQRIQQMQRSNKKRKFIEFFFHKTKYLTTKRRVFSNALRLNNEKHIKEYIMLFNKSTKFLHSLNGPAYIITLGQDDNVKVIREQYWLYGVQCSKKHWTKKSLQIKLNNIRAIK
jgi:hypothetical protein